MTPRQLPLIIACVLIPALGLDTTTISISKTSGPVNVVSKVCDVCECTADKIDCSNRNLDNNLNDHEWPKQPIKVITFENNRITHINSFPNLTVNKLIFYNNKIKTIDNKAFKMLSNLTELDLSENLLTHENFMPGALEGQFLPEAYEPLDKLKLLNLSGNKFNTLNHDLFEHVQYLKTLILSDNPFVELDKSSILAISSIPYLEKLDLSHCQLKKLDKVSFQSLRFLKKLDLSWNEFSNLPDALQESKSVEILILDGNPIEFLNDNNGFPPLLNVRMLSMCKMPKLLLIGKGALSSLEGLETLKIENCTLLSEINDDALAKEGKGGGATWPPLKVLNISNNALHYLSATLVARWDKLQELHIMSNNWNCDCDNQYLIGTLLSNHGKRLMGEEIGKLRCSGPPELAGRSLASLGSRKLRCLDAYGARPERDAAILLGILVGLLLALPLLLLIFVLWRRGFIFCGPQGPATFSRAFYKRTSPYDNEDT
ncbi:PREDICTED: TLR4 interactor with leucine rich repeats-like [Ceratosolen solmsi marchali]|uniref:TLR4 interactor with leucine rich repeats-like n=1 Tax=Ceratosolen solmsi marchali TaxID=326594 RepID=A0AAJ7DX55_9HYME|nr:PREDICTED: TLR4 interactor with leucine rich repeats-like [Ceratosolen solmsi marchali]